MTRLRVGEQIGERLLQLFPIRYLSGAVSRHERLCEHRKIFHVRPENDRDPGNDCFHRILSALRSQAFANEDDRGQTVPSLELAGLVEQHTVWLCLWKSHLFAGQQHMERERFKLFTDFSRALDVPWRNE